MANRRSTDDLILPALVILALGAVAFALVFPGSRVSDQIGAFLSHAAGPQDFSVSQRVPVCRGGAFLCVVDGDTLRHGENRLRLQDIDTPEIGEPGCEAERQLGLVARDRLAEILSQKPFDVRHDGTDRFGRALVELRNDDGSIGRTLVDEGLAHWFEERRSWC